MLIDCIEQVEFSAAKLKQPKLVWLDKALYQALSNNKEAGDLENDCLEQYAFSTETILLNAELLEKQKKVFTAERYGGPGIGSNGGGARCGNNGNIQVKGIGANMLASKKSDQLHRYGGLNLHDAVLECIYSTILNNVLPLGCVSCLGIVLTGDNTAYQPGELVATTKGALLMREVATRPAHFLPAPHFEPEDKDQIFNDIYRLRKTNKLLAKKFTSHNDLILFFGKFLQNCANQFAFAKVFRIFHGCITASNIAIDGRWLDLTTSSFIESNKNYYINQQNLPFLDEHLSASHIINDLLYQCGKFNLVDLNSEVLTQYYEEQYHAYFNHHFAKVIGLPDTIDGKITDAKSYKLLVKSFSELLTRNNKLEKFTNEHNEDNDPVDNLLSAWFVDINSEKKLPPEGLSYSLNVVLKSYHRSIKNNKTPINTFKISQSIKALRRLYYSPFFYSGKIQTGLQKDIESNTFESDCFGQLIESYREISAWMFNANDSQKTVIFKHNQLTITFDVDNNHYQINMPDIDSNESSNSNSKGVNTGDSTNKQIITVNTASELSDEIALIDDALFTINYFNFKPYIQKLLSTLGQR